MTRLNGMLTALFYLLKRNSHIFVCSVIAFFLRAIPHLFMIPFLAIEEDVHWLFVYKLMNNDFSSVFAYPHATHFLVAGIRSLFSLPAGIVESFINPLLGALTIPCIIFLLRGLYKANFKRELVVSILIVFLEIHIYRTSIWQSTETLGVILLFLVLGCVVRKQWRFVIPLLLILTQTHYLSLIVGCFVILLYGLLTFPLKKKFLLILGFSLLGVIAVFTFPYTMSTDRFIYTVSCFNPSNIFVVYSLNNILGAFLLYPLTIISLFALLLYLIRGKMPLLRILGFVVFVSGLVSLVFYNPLLIGPYRFVMYGGLFGTFCLSLILVKLNKKILITILVVICLLSVLAVYPRGLNEVLLIDKVGTLGELKAAEWLSVNVKNFYIGFVATDIANYAVLMFVTKYQEFSNPLMAGEELQKRRMPILAPSDEWADIKVIVNGTETYIVRWIFWSTRMEKQAVFYDLTQITNNTLRITYIFKPVLDIWWNNTNFKTIYNNNGGVKIYERVSN